MIGDHIPLEKLPLNDLLGFLEINPPRIPYKSLTGAPVGVPLSILNEVVLTSAATGFSASLGSQLASKNYAHLLCVVTAKSTGAQAALQLGFNADIAANYTHSYVGSSASSGSAETSITLPACVAASTSVSRGLGLFLVPSFLEAGAAKALIGVSGGAGGQVFVCTGSWSGTDPVSQLDFSSPSTMDVGSRFSFYALGAQ